MYNETLLIYIQNEDHDSLLKNIIQIKGKGIRFWLIKEF
jgi:hypothetical protein